MPEHPEHPDPADELRRLVRLLNRDSFLPAELRRVKARKEPEGEWEDPHLVAPDERMVRVF